MANWKLLALCVGITSFVGICKSSEDILEYESLQPHYELDEECLRQTAPSEEDVEAIRGLLLPTTRQGKCLLACVYKKNDVMTDHGRYNAEGSKAAAAKTLGLTSEALKRANKLVDLCSILVDNIEDDEEGCEVAAAIFACSSENGRQLGMTSAESSEEDDDDEP